MVEGSSPESVEGESLRGVSEGGTEGEGVSPWTGGPVAVL